MSSRRETIIKDTFTYTGSNYVASALGFFTSMFLKRFLGPLDAGYWALLTVIHQYVEYLGLGTKVALSREIPQAVGKQEEDKIEPLQNTVYTWLLLTLVLGFPLIFLFYFFLLDITALVIPCILLGFLIVANHMYTLVLTIARAKKQFAAVGWLIIVNSLLSFICVLVLYLFFRIAGFKLVLFVLGMCVVNFLSFRMGLKRTKIKFSLSLDWSLFGKLVHIGLPMWIAGVLFTTFLNIDRIMIGKLINIESLGFYTIAIMAAVQLQAIPKFFNVVIFPHIQEDYGASGDLSSSRGLILKSIYFTSRLMPFILGVLMFFMHALVQYFLPRFIPGLNAMNILLFGFYFVVLSQIFPSVIFTVDRQAMMIPVYTAVIGVSILLNFLFIRLGWGIEGVALGTAISHFLFFLIVSFYASQFFLERKELFKIYASIFMYFIYFLAGIALIGRIDIPERYILNFVIRFDILCLMSIPVFVQMQRREKFFTSLWKALKKGGKK